MNIENLDLTKEFFLIYREGNRIIIDTNSPNDSVGDLAFEWDLDGSQRKAWEERMAELERQGIRGQLVHSKMRFKHDPKWDGFLNSAVPPTPKFESHKMLIVDFGEVDLWMLKPRSNE